MWGAAGAEKAEALGEGGGDTQTYVLSGEEPQLFVGTNYLHMLKITDNIPL